ncbi:uncharacterized protein PV09_02200 [Verruconis gallopava]|uniref:Uncharacterized protein n=1 Tax=Verruconis gallopava TaxID=253628 RepID=A0A0D2B7Z5_9PEZI|nr:uncharacterized protein PV09_02200 [Verruconis gallopava]KIW07354.1 hypothetical protein PV09_02200 [Verruconis gallopava]
MYAKIVCHPPLGQPTVVPAGQCAVDFIVLLETAADSSTSKKQWQVSLWHDLDAEGDEWNSSDFTEIHDDDEARPSIQSLGSAQSQNKYFKLTLKGRPANKSTVRFTVRYRANSDAPWKWAHSQFSHGDGVLHYQERFEQHDLSHYLRGTSSHIKFESIAAETPDTQLWSLTAPVKAANGDESGYCTHQLGLPESCTRWFALVRLWAPWLAPRQGRDKFICDKEAVLASFLREDGLNVVILAISGIDDVLTLLKNDDTGNVLISGRNDSEQPGTCRVLVAVSTTFEVANAAVMYQARRMVMEIRSASGESDAVAQAVKDGGVKPDWLEEWADGFAYCTWNSLGQNLTEQKIYDALESFEKVDVKITNLIIDDNWQSLDHEGQEQYVRRMTRFEANSKGFPHGLRHTVREIRKNHPSIQHIAVWHAIMGYWGGISPDGQIAKDYKTVKVAGPDWLCIDPEDISRWYNDFYSFLSESGIDSVKTDAQFMLDNLQSAKDRRRMIREYQDAWSIAMLRKFWARAISCMSQTPQILFHSQLPTNKPKLLVRNSDDFFPDVESSHPWHIFCNAHNSLLTQHLNVLPDWDMFQTSHPWAEFHAAARCLSGGPIYITDSPGQHNVDLIRQMTAKTPRGNTVILRPHRLGKSSQAYVGYEEPRLLKIETYVGAAKTGSGILGVFNVTQGTVSEIITLDDIPGSEDGEYIIRSHVAKTIGPPTTRADRKSIIKMELGPKGYDILSATPLRRFQIKSGEVAIASLGLLGKLSGAAAIVGNDIYTERSGRLRAYTSFKALGIIGFYISGLEARSIEDDFMGLMFGKPIPLHCVKKSVDYKNVLEIDTEKAWAESDQKASWSNEVHFELFILQ